MRALGSYAIQGEIVVADKGSTDGCIEIAARMRARIVPVEHRLDLRCTGMEFATEMIIKAALFHQSITEVPITLHPDGRKSHSPHLKTFRDGWRTLRLFLICSPRWLFLIPGILLFLLVFLGYAITMPGLKVLGATFEAHTLLVGSMAFLLGYQLMIFAILTKTFGISEGLLPPDPRMDLFFKIVNLKKAFIFGASSLLCGLALLFVALNEWHSEQFGPLDYAHTMRWVIPGVTVITFGFQTIFSRFMVCIIGLGRK